MTPFEDPIPIRLLEEQADLTKFGLLFRTWRESSGLLSSGISDPIITHDLVVSVHEIDSGKVGMPRILMVGNFSLAATILGRKWSSRPADIAPAQIISEENCAMMAEGYVKAAAGEPSFSHISLPTPLANGEIEFIPYQRLVLPFSNGLGTTFYLTLAYADPDTAGYLRSTIPGVAISGPAFEAGHIHMPSNRSLVTSPNCGWPRFSTISTTSRRLEYATTRL